MAQNLNNQSNAVIQKDEETGKFKEKDLQIKLEPEFIPHIDSLENLGDQNDLIEFADKNGLNPRRLALYRDIFNIYDDGTFECVLTIQTALFSKDKKFMRIVKVAKGSKI